MATAAAHGIAARLPHGFEAHIFKRDVVGDEQSYPVAHFATFALPQPRADFGGGAVTLMRPSDIFAVLFEYGPESAGRQLFARDGLPRSLQESHFRPYLLRRGLADHAGTQWFFTEGGRPFTFYAVLGSYLDRRRLVPHVNALLAGITIDRRTLPLDGSWAPWN